MSSEVNENRQRHAAATSNGEPDQLISVISAGRRPAPRERRGPVARAKVRRTVR
ncbi:hypothetical protein J4558_08190 [Leptolyngbya sp. 15MV]|nr:hypothetical protein J4558_08190 [Leptolyngbya sp. 15MV]